MHIYIYITYVKKTSMCPPSYNKCANGLIVTRTLGHMMNESSCAQVHELP